MAYYYLMAQLPYLVYEQKSPMSSADFMDLASPMLTKNDAALLKQLSLTPKDKTTGCDFIDGWRDWDKSLRLNLARLRAIKLNRELPSEQPPVINVNIIAVASKAVDEPAVEGEMILDKARWRAIEDLAGGNDYFHRNNVFAYYLKLLLIERRQSFDVEKGFVEYKSLYASIMESAQNSGDLK